MAKKEESMMDPRGEVELHAVGGRARPAAPAPSVHALCAARRPVAASDETAPRLTAREFEVLSWLACGKSGGEISTILGISVPTVRIHIRNIFRKLEAANIAHAVARAFSIGIL